MKIVKDGPITYIIGPKNSGKSTFLFNLIKNSPEAYAGFISLPMRFHNKRKGYFLYGIGIPFNEIISSPDPIMVHPPLLYWRNRYFSLSLFNKVTMYIMKNFDREKIYIIDEYGPLEKSGNGWNNLIDFLVKTKCKMMVVSTMRSGEKKLEIPI